MLTFAKVSDKFTKRRIRIGIVKTVIFATSQKGRCIVNSKNLILNNKRSPDELREMGRKGGIASGKARRKKRNLQEMIKLYFEVVHSMSEEDKAKMYQVCDKQIKDFLKRRL